MARKQQNDPLRYAANLTALAAAVYLGVTALLRLAVGQLLRLFNKSATLENPIAVPEWVLGVFNVLLPAAGLAAAFWLLAVGVRATPMRLRLSHAALSRLSQRYQSFLRLTLLPIGRRLSPRRQRQHGIRKFHLFEFGRFGLAGNKQSFLSMSRPRLAQT